MRLLDLKMWRLGGADVALMSAVASIAQATFPGRAAVAACVALAMR
jgi:hypothetical protein